MPWFWWITNCHSPGCQCWCGRGRGPQCPVSGESPTVPGCGESPSLTSVPILVRDRMKPWFWWITIIHQCVNVGAGQDESLHALVRVNHRPSLTSLSMLVQERPLCPGSGESLTITHQFVNVGAGGDKGLDALVLVNHQQSLTAVNHWPSLTSVSMLVCDRMKVFMPWFWWITDHHSPVCWRWCATGWKPSCPGSSELPAITHQRVDAGEQRVKPWFWWIIDHHSPVCQSWCRRGQRPWCPGSGESPTVLDCGESPTITHQCVDVGAGQDESLHALVLVDEKVEQQGGLVVTQRGAQRLIQLAVLHLESGWGLHGSRLVCNSQEQLETVNHSWKQSPTVGNSQPWSAKVGNSQQQLETVNHSQQKSTTVGNKSAKVNNSWQ